MKNLLGNRYILSVFGIFSVIFYALSFFTIQTSGWIMLLKAFGFSVSALLFLLFCINIKSHTLRKQIIIINIILIIIHIVLAFVALNTVLLIRNYSASAQIILWVIVPSLILLKYYRDNPSAYNQLWNGIKSKKNLFIGASIISLLAIMCSYDVNGPHFLWDSNLAYNFVLRDIKLLSLFEPQSLVFSNHIAFSYFYPVSLLAQLLDSVDLGFFCYNAICLMIATFGFVFLFYDLFPKEKTSIILLATAVCMLSPYTFGISTLQIYDFAAICVTPMLLWTAIRKKWALFLMLGLYTSFIKEPGVIYFGALCAVTILSDLIFEKKKIKSILREPVIYYMVLVGLLFVVIYSKVGNYSDMQGEGFGVQINHINDILKMFCILNFSWILIILSIATIIFVFFKIGSHSRLKRPVMIISIPGLVFLAINCFIMSYLNPRYTDFFYPTILILSLILLLSFIRHETYRISALVGLMILFIVSDFTSIDPVSNLVYDKVDIGDAKLYSTIGPDSFMDGAVYNRQYYGFDVLMNKVLAKAIQNKDELLTISTGNSNISWQMSGKWDAGTEICDFDEFWDTQKEIRTPGFLWDYYDDPRYITMKVKYIYTQHDTVEELKKGDTFTYIYMPTLNEGKENLVRSAFHIIEEGEYTYRGWKISYIRGRTDKQ